MKRGAHPDSWLTAADFTSEGRTLIIKGVSSEEIEPKVTKKVVSFTNESKGLVLNEVNERIIAKNTGQIEPKDWAGYQITPYSTSIKMRGEDTPCIRVKILVGKIAAKV